VAPFIPLPLIFEVVNLVLYADDINILVVEIEEETLQRKIVFVMQQLEIWSQNNYLIVNSEKTCAISFNCHQNRHLCRTCIIFNRNEIAYSSGLKFLGPFITENLAWHVQIHSLCPSLNKVCNKR